MQVKQRNYIYFIGTFFSILSKRNTTKKNKALRSAIACKLIQTSIVDDKSDCFLMSVTAVLQLAIFSLFSGFSSAFLQVAIMILSIKLCE